MTKHCRRCEQEKPFPESFFPQPRYRDGHSNWCRDCYREVRRARYLNKREHELAVNRAWAQNNIDRRRKIDIVKAHRRRALVRGAKGHATVEQIEARRAYYGNRCWMCGCEATEMDHVIPLARGGTNWPANLRPACRKCNASKRHFERR